MNELIITVDDVRATKLCLRGSRVVCAAHGLSWDHFVTNGYTVSTLAACNDPLINRVIEKARKREAAAHV